MSSNNVTAITKVVFLVEEPSMKLFLDGYLPRLGLKIDFLVIPHEGKSDLEKSIPRKLRGWQEPGVFFFVLRDQDAGDCRKIKERLQKLCLAGKRPDTIVRIVCKELESWFLGDLSALDQTHRTKLAKSKQRGFKPAPDTVVSPSDQLKKSIKGYQKRAGARDISQHMTLDPAQNRSHSFGVFIRSLRPYLETSS